METIFPQNKYKVENVPSDVSVVYVLCADQTGALILSPAPWHSLTSGKTVAGCIYMIRHMCLAYNKFITAAKTALGCSRHTFLMWNKLVCFFETKKKSSKALQSCARKHDKNIKGRRSRKETQINKGLACYLLSYFFSCFLFAAWPFSLLWTNSKFAGISPRGKLDFLGGIRDVPEFLPATSEFLVWRNCISPRGELHFPPTNPGKFDFLSWGI